MIVTSFQGLKYPGKQISPTFSYFPINNVLLYHFLANSLAHNTKMTDKSVFLHNYSQSPVFGFRKGGEILTFLIRQNTEKENCYRIYFVLLYLHVPLYCGDFIKQKNCHVRFKKQNKYSNFVNYVL